jgi:mRNA interferase MazF
LKGKIVLIPFPFTDLTSTKLRPALVLYEGEKDVVVAFISSRIEKTKPTDVLINRNHPEFTQTGLKLESSLKLEKIATLSKELIIGEIGEVGPNLKKEINDKISKTFKL